MNTQKNKTFHGWLICRYQNIKHYAMHCCRHRGLLIVLLSLGCVSPSAYASYAYSVDLTVILQNLLDYLTSTPACILAVLAIAGVGYHTLHTGKVPKHVGVSVILGIGIIFGSSILFKTLTGLNTY